MGVKTVIKEVIDNVVTSIFPGPKRLYISSKCQRKMTELGLSEEDVRDVFYHGESFTTKNGSRASRKRYYENEIGMTYIQGNNTGDYIATFVWRQSR